MQAQVVSNNAITAFSWLQNVGRNTEFPRFDIPQGDRNRDGLITISDGDGTPDGRSDHPVCLTDLPTMRATACLPAGQPVQAPRAWIVSVCASQPDGTLYPSCVPDAGDPLAPRRVTIEADAQVGAATKRIRATYEFDLGVSDVFRYAYFTNNYGWFATGAGSTITVNGEVRANGNLDFTGDMTHLKVNGDLHASSNPEVVQPSTSEPATGTITGNPSHAADLLSYWQTKPVMARPGRDPFLPNQPAIRGKDALLPYGEGWDSDQPQQRFPSQPTKEMPYLGDLSLYKQLSSTTGRDYGSGYVSWGYLDPSGSYHVGELWQGMVYEDAEWGQTESGEWIQTGGPPPRSADDPTTPVVIQGWIWLDGPVVVGGDVIIKGMLDGYGGTIYAGRNIHIVGDLQREEAWASPEWPRLERNPADGMIQVKDGYDAPSWIGTVCNDGTYVSDDWTWSEAQQQWVQSPIPAGCVN